MLFLLATTLQEHFGALRVFQYPSFRIPAAALTALLLMLLFFPRFIEWLRQQQHGVSNVREYTPEAHKKKTGTPTMGGVFVLAVVVLVSGLWADPSSDFVWTTLFVMVSFGCIGFYDDYRKVKYRDSKGLSPRGKLGLQILVLGLVTGWLVMRAGGALGPSDLHLDTRLAVPFVSTAWFHPDIGWLYLPFAFVVVMGTSHAVNLTDGLDGLAIGPVIVSSLTFLVLAYAAGSVLGLHTSQGWVEFNIAEYLNIAFTPGAAELGVVCSAIAGAGVGFLWFNAFPATVFMGDVGSLGLGGALGAMAVLTKNELLSAIIHGVFLAETLSVMAQVASFKLTGKRVFRMAPIHHHFELKGWPEPKIIVRFWIVAIVLALIGLMSLKLR